MAISPSYWWLYWTEEEIESRKELEYIEIGPRFLQLSFLTFEKSVGLYQSIYWMITRLVVSAMSMSSRNSPGFHSSILWHSGICGAAEEIVLNKVLQKSNNIFPLCSTLSVFLLVFACYLIYCCGKASDSYFFFVEKCLSFLLESAIFGRMGNLFLD